MIDMSSWHHRDVATIGQRIRAARLREGWTQTAFAKEVGCGLATLKYLEKHPGVPDGSVYLERILALLRIDPDATGQLDIDPDDPPLSRATDLQIAAEHYRRAADRAGTASPATVPAAAGGFGVRDGQIVTEADLAGPDASTGQP